MNEKTTQQSVGVVSDLNNELGFKVGDKCLVVFRPNHLTDIEDGIIIECRVEAIEQTTRADSVSVKTSRRYIVGFFLQSTTVTEDVMFRFEDISKAQDLAKTYLTQSIESAKSRIKKLEMALALTKT